MQNEKTSSANQTKSIVSERWECKYYGSGTCIVENALGPKEAFKYGVHNLSPHFYIYGPGNPDESKYMRDRVKCCEDIRDFMNGGDRPAWLDDLWRVNESHAEDFDGTKITATGPSFDASPPACDWRQNDTQEAKDARARLMDRLFLSSR